MLPKEEQKAGSSPSLGGRWRRPGGSVTERGSGSQQLRLPHLALADSGGLRR